MIAKLKWTDAFFRRDVFKDEKGFQASEDQVIKEIVLNLTECPGCGYVFENAFHKKSNDMIIFTHGWRQRTNKCEMIMADIRTTYHIKRAAKIAQGKVRS